MDRMKTFLKYLIAFIALYFLSNALIELGLNNSYKHMEIPNGPIESRKL